MKHWEKLTARRLVIMTDSMRDLKTDLNLGTKTVTSLHLVKLMGILMVRSMVTSLHLVRLKEREKAK